LIDRATQAGTDTSLLDVQDLHVRFDTSPWMILFPGAAISLTVFAFNLFGDALRDYLDPRFKT
jgi:ABC-type dipeptide/oligopeptide/nickel transport system permease subunit